MVPTRNLVVKAAAGWAKAEFTPEQIVAAVKKGASCVRDHLVHKATMKGAVYPKIYKHLPRLLLNNGGTLPKLDLPNKGEASNGTLYEYPILRREDLTVFTSNIILHFVHPDRVLFQYGGEKARFCGLVSHAGVVELGLDGGQYVLGDPFYYIG